MRVQISNLEMQAILKAVEECDNSSLKEVCEFLNKDGFDNALVKYTKHDREVTGLTEEEIEAGRDEFLTYDFNINPNMVAEFFNICTKYGKVLIPMIKGLSGIFANFGDEVSKWEKHWMDVRNTEEACGKTYSLEEALNNPSILKDGEITFEDLLNPEYHAKLAANIIVDKVAVEKHFYNVLPEYVWLKDMAEKYPNTGTLGHPITELNDIGIFVGMPYDVAVKYIETYFVQKYNDLLRQQ